MIAFNLVAAFRNSACYIIANDESYPSCRKDVQAAYRLLLSTGGVDVAALAEARREATCVAAKLKANPSPPVAGCVICKGSGCAVCRISKPVPFSNLNAQLDERPEATIAQSNGLDEAVTLEIMTADVWDSLGALPPRIDEDGEPLPVWCY